jgi:hypothetical protein
MSSQPTNQHLDHDQLMNYLYGLDGRDGSHVAGCQECRARLDAMRTRQASSAAVPDFPPELLATQRRKIYARLEQTPGRKLSWIPALAAACLLAIGVFIYGPAPVPAPSQPSADAQLFSDVYSMEQSTEPRAGAPIHGLFEDNE